jgi:probable HAF family extracellular repeat protein
MLKLLVQLLSIGSLALSVALVSSAQASPIYSLTDLGTLGGQFSVATAINDAGQVVGVSQTGNGEAHATLFNTSGGANRDLGTLGGHASDATAINNAGQVVGAADTAAGKERATLFNTSGGANRDLGTLGGGTSEATSISDAGQIVGAADTATGQRHATLFNTGSGTNRDLGTLGGNASIATSINNAGEIVGSADTAAGRPHATLFTTTGGANRDLGTLGGEFSIADSINGKGQAVGIAQVAGGGGHAALFSTSGGANHKLDTLGSTLENFARATAINDVGQIVGGGATGRTLSENFAFLFQSGSFFDLNDLIDSADPLFGNVLLVTATDINNRGQIVGYGSYVENGTFGRARAFLLTPVLIPEPATLAVIAAGITGLMGLGLRMRQH